MNPLQTFEMLGIVLFRFHVVPRIWAVLLMLVNGGALLFIHTSYGQIALVAVCAAVLAMSIIYARLGFVRLLGVGHVFWIPMLIWFAMDLPDRTAQPWLYHWVICLLVCNSISLVIDTIDMVRFIRGERQPHYSWNASDAD